MPLWRDGMTYAILNDHSDTLGLFPFLIVESRLGVKQTAGIAVE